jgi:hypothetical protein
MALLERRDRRTNTKASQSHELSLANASRWHPQVDSGFISISPFDVTFGYEKSLWIMLESKLNRVHSGKLWLNNLKFFPFSLSLCFNFLIYLNEAFLKHRDEWWKISLKSPHNGVCRKLSINSAAILALKWLKNKIWGLSMRKRRLECSRTNLNISWCLEKRWRKMGEIERREELIFR